MSEAPRRRGKDATGTKRQSDLRARRALLGLAEVRGVYLPPSLHAKLKGLAAELLKNTD